ncbi:hypothetical protein [Ramlibacter sp.]|uniref:hypothetical protein n=1 Tax=Ramlibacter sp. TaxID=1917967 RepID=UPI003D12E24E
MNALALAVHLAGFVLPAAAVAALVALAARFILRGARESRWWVAPAVNFASGVAALAAGLAMFGRDGKMATYAALVVAVATSQWMVSRGWRTR